MIHSDSYMAYLPLLSIVLIPMTICPYCFNVNCIVIVPEKLVPPKAMTGICPA